MSWMTVISREVCDQVHRRMTLQYYLVNLELHGGKEKLFP